MDMANRVQSYPDRTLYEEIYSLIAETFQRCGYWVDLGLQLTRLFLDGGLGLEGLCFAAPNATHHELTDLAEGGKPHAAQMAQLRDCGRVIGSTEITARNFHVASVSFQSERADASS